MAPMLLFSCTVVVACVGHSLSFGMARNLCFFVSLMMLSNLCAVSPVH